MRHNCFVTGLLTATLVAFVLTGDRVHGRKRRNLSLPLEPGCNTGRNVVLHGGFSSSLVDRRRLSHHQFRTVRLRGGTEETGEEAEKPKIKPLFNSKSAVDGAAADGDESPKNTTAYSDINARGGNEDEWAIKSENQIEEKKKDDGEEDEDTIWQSKVHLFRMNNQSEWKQRAVGPCRFLQHKESKKIRITVRDDRILKVRANHFILPGTVVVAHKQCPTAWVYSTPDFSEDINKATLEIFCFRFESKEIANSFYGNFSIAAKKNEKVFSEELDVDLGKVEREKDEKGEESENEDRDTDHDKENASVPGLKEEETDNQEQLETEKTNDKSKGENENENIKDISEKVEGISVAKDAE